MEGWLRLADPNCSSAVAFPGDGGRIFDVRVTALEKGAARDGLYEGTIRYCSSGGIELADSEFLSQPLLLLYSWS